MARSSSKAWARRLAASITSRTSRTRSRPGATHRHFAPSATRFGRPKRTSPECRRSQPACRRRKRVELETIVADLIQKVERRFYGKYRGFVVNADDPKHLGRLRLRIPSVLG